ncbi:3-oxoacyl-[acyl-carrier-protein] synthase-3 [Hydrogenispora ethanolica]|jgi:3-oxoacyl-[acyl-carrier-protein] synthase-3|uniref:3-oxoacyl-[acyl-carrier-protein] synthase-3 n=1 Tax=Hydrogenispora ethanolica TaxID=1082276 RepID=A0A4R1S726_HYDET|nr:ketoacyl-ACP synthase III [Hydrogenispora ethanolica]TCL74272.1 3-oxoacyl-[acyl-carrier-protein] synthase-3 [Hydrogenispora ethanolica]
MGLSIAGIGYYLPDHQITNDQLLQMLRTRGGPDVDIEKLAKKLTLNQAELRHFKAPGESGADMAAQAAQNCLAKTNFDPRDLDFILYVGMLRDYVEPAMAIILQDRLGANRAHAFDLSNACNSFLNGMEIADLYIKSGKYRNALIVAAEDGSERIPWHLFDSGENLSGFSALTISDGAAAMLLRDDPEHRGFTEFDFETYGQYNDLCRVKIGKERDDLKILVKSKRLAMTALEILPQFVPAFLEKARNILGDIDIWFFHQVTGDPRKFWGDLDENLVQKAYNTFSRVGNTGSASIPLGMALAEENGRLKRGDRVAAVVGASGFSCGGTAFIY